MPARVLGVSLDGQHRFSKSPVAQITLQAGYGVVGDAHAGATVQHRSRVDRDPSQPNLRQVHLLHVEFLDAARAAGFDVEQGDLGENILTQGMDLLGLARGSRLRIGSDAVVEITGLRNPCAQINDFRPGLLELAVARGDDGAVVRRLGIMGVVLCGGVIRPGDAIHVEQTSGPRVPLEVV